MSYGLFGERVYDTYSSKRKHNRSAHYRIGFTTSVAVYEYKGNLHADDIMRAFIMSVLVIGTGPGITKTSQR